MKARKRRLGAKFSPGPVIKSVDELLLARDQGRWIYLGATEYQKVRLWGRPRAYHPQWICNMSFNCVCSYIKNGVLHLANRNAEYPYVFKAVFMQSYLPEVSSEWWATCSELPVMRIAEFTKEAVISAAKKAVRAHTGDDARFVIQFGAPKTYVSPVPLLLK